MNFKIGLAVSGMSSEDILKKEGNVLGELALAPLWLLWGRGMTFSTFSFGNQGYQFEYVVLAVKTVLNSVNSVNRVSSLKRGATSISDGIF